MRALALLALILALPQAQSKSQDSKIPKDPIRDWKYQRKDLRFDPGTGREVEEVTALLAGDEAVAVDFDKKIFDLRGVNARYFTEPDRNKLSQEILVRSNRGRYNHEARTLKLDEHVRVVKKNEDEQRSQVDTVLLASSALLRFNRMYECPACRKLPVPNKLFKSAGRCVDHDVPLKEATITSLEVDGEFNLSGPEGILSGEGLVTDDAIKREYHITRNGFVEFGSDPSTLLGERKAPETPEARFSQVFSRGPLHITGEERERKITGQDGMRIDRIDSTGTLTVRAQNMAIESFRHWDPAAKKLSPPELRNVDARGVVVMEGVIFEDGSAFHTRSDSMTRVVETRKNQETQKDEMWEIIRLKSSEVPVHVQSGANTIESRAVTITRKSGESGGESEFEGVSRSDLVAGTQHFALKADRLTTYAEPNMTGRTDLREIRAEGGVVLGGLMAASAAPRPGPKEPPGEARADRFTWDVVTNRGWLEATPFVRITQGPSTIIAPKVVLESPNIIVLKGPKQVHLVQEREGVKEDYRATCEGDLVLDHSTHRLWMRDRCVIRTQDFLLQSDRVAAILSEDGKGLESLLARGQVHALRRADHTHLYGERLAFRMKDPQDLRVYGNPYAVADTGHTTATQEQIRVYEKKNPKTGETIRYTEMVGGSAGVRIEIDDRPKPGDKK